MRRQQNAAQHGGEAVMDGTLPLPMSAQECQNRCHSDERCKVCLLLVFHNFVAVNEFRTSGFVRT